MARTSWKRTQRDYIIYNRTIPARSGNYVDYPEEMLPEIRAYLTDRNISKLYSHQAEMFRATLENKNVVITTSTASGKTLGFLLPVLQQILKNPATRAIFIYPTKALASDQMRAIMPIIEYFGSNRIFAGVYDGDTPPHERRQIRNSANIILTNPDMLNSSFLPNHSSEGFSFMFSNLKYIVIDELHTYRGAFGSHLANVFRRLGRICRYYSSSPRFLCSSATIANPIELAEKICGHKFVLVDQDGSPSSERHYHLVQPPRIGSENYERVPASRVTAEFIPELVMEKHHFIAFCKSRNSVEVILREARESLTNIEQYNIGYPDMIAGYRGGYKPQERKLLERKMVTDEILGLISTNILELGIDIGNLDTTILTGFPGTRASFWQQSGRAGRNGGQCDTYLVLDILPKDQYIAIDPDWLFASQSEHAVVDKNNLFIQLAHVRAAAAELPLTLDDQTVFPAIAEIIPVLIRANELKAASGKFRWCGSAYPAGDFSLRNIDKVRYKLVDENAVTIAEFDELQAFREIHKGCIYMHNGQSYHVLRLDIEARTAYAETVDDNYYTETQVVTRISIIKEQKRKPFHRTSVHFGDINVEDYVGGHKKVQFHNHQNLGYEEVDLPLSKGFDTEGTWLVVPENVFSVFEAQKLNGSGHSVIQGSYKSYMDGLAYCIHNAAMMATMTTDSELGVGSLVIDSLPSRKFIVCLFDYFTGGVGYCEKAFDIIEDVIQNAIKMVKGCSCKQGCPACVGDYRLDKKLILWGLENFFEQTEPPTNISTKNEPETFVIEKEFTFEKICEKWPEFQQYIAQTGGVMSSFLSQVVKGVRIDGTKLILQLENEITLNQAQSPENIVQVMNILIQHIAVPYNFDIEYELQEEGKKDINEKIARHFSHLKGN